ncbi:hypothetical protein AMS68_004618 [Peltaster fructicola]|uniref:alpha-L-rhamnosidase n=1 Tax=Peltaster fructicola TaxID=286661 RepID=A0A6H0XWR0_9PEZI|nr:hypothetical protein AMS68_004618 [Peltaster fructicola]
MEVIRTGIHGFADALGIDTNELAFFWSLDSTVTCDCAAYLVVVDTSKKVDLDTHERAFWSSGKINSTAQRDILCRPEHGFAATTQYYWRVWIWDSTGTDVSSSWSAFFTAYPRSNQLPPYSMNQKYMPHTSLIFRSWFADEHDRWKAIWIGNGTDKPYYLRHSFSLQRAPSQVIAFASGLGHFNLSCNGAPASSHLLSPGWTNYHKTVQFVAFDLTDQVNAGSNTIGAHVGNGFYAGDQGDRFFWPMYEDNTYVRYGNELCFFAELHVFYDDGQHDLIISDPTTWKTHSSATTLANIYASETHDRRLYPQNWDTPSFDDSDWAFAKALTGPRGKLKYQSQPPVVVQEVFEPVNIDAPAPDTLCFDLGQNSSIVTRIQVSGPAGSTIKIRHSETVDEHGLVSMPDPLFKAFETDVYSLYTLAGAGTEIWQPDFCFTSARYIQIEGARQASDDEQSHAHLPVIHSVQGQNISSASRSLGFVRTDVEDVNALIKACYYSFTSNLFSYHTDCPQIEKFAWQEVTHLLFPATQYMRDIESLHTKIIDDIVDAQESDGLCPTMAPEMRYMCGPLHNTITWGCSVCFLPMLIKKYYGSTGSFGKAYPAAKAYMQYIKRWERDGGIIEHGLGDWGRGIAWGNLQANIETAVYIECLRGCAMMAEELSLSSEAEHWQAEVRRIKDVYNKLLLVTDDTSRPYAAYYTSRDNLEQRDCDAIAQALALQFDLVPNEHIPHVQQAFLDDVKDCKIRAGEIGLRYLWNTLRDLNRPDIVLAMARQEEHPSYMRFLRRGETTLLEFWQDACRSKCHDMLGTIYEWFYDAVLGLRVVEDAYKVFEIRPCYEGEFKLVEGAVECPYGKIDICFRKEEPATDKQQMTLSATVPFGTTARVALPPRIIAAEESGRAISTSVPLVLQPGKHKLTFVVEI